MIYRRFKKFSNWQKTIIEGKNCQKLLLYSKKTFEFTTKKQSVKVQLAYIRAEPKLSKIKNGSTTQYIEIKIVYKALKNVIFIFEKSIKQEIADFKTSYAHQITNYLLVKA
ncbi:hypothetical protein DMUE_2307 [Dictyocoela muelleri]|nr:hypothetical protein DMUE_2307 [Dictyocoela muelleri]